MADATTTHEITAPTRAWQTGESQALEDLVPLVYQELKRLARRYAAADRHGGGIDTTTLVHEAYLKLVDMHDARWEDRAHFYALAGRVMRSIVVDAARARSARKRGGRAGAAANADPDQIADMGDGQAEEILAVHEALEHLAAVAARQVCVVEMRFFVGLSVKETAEILQVSPQTVMRDWKLAKAWLRRKMRGGADGSSA